MRRRLPWLVGLLLLIAGVLALLWWPRIEKLEVAVPAGSPVQPETLARRLQPFVGRRFMELSLADVRRAVVADPWVAEATVRRIWPDRLSVSVRLQKPVARWGETGLVNPRGEVFHPADVTAWRQLLPLWSPDEADAPRLLAAARWLRTQTKLIGWTLVGLTRHPGGSLETHWLPARILWLDGTDYRSQFERFLRAWPQVKPELREQATEVDLRYSNGFTIVAASKTDKRRRKQTHGAKETD
ncbi:FtsQ-type POTRA domain-containing protein [Sulfurivirga sp.]|uniref:cell division protein FtsQ/DivIB n=1 Tax=Sulfurivirga sp. TaxID=2614236 RepID=UPI0025E9E937|nr:FtsQ-type POTRA domain-containing protein [Sulfurivirga sp.]